MKEIFVPAKISKVITIDPGEIRKVELTLPARIESEDKSYPIRDDMRPGTAFLAKPFGVRTGKVRRRMYTRSNCSACAEHRLETIINYTHEEKADTSLWWQTDEVWDRHVAGDSIDVRLIWDERHETYVVYENSAIIHPTNLRLEPDGEWEAMRFLGIAFSTGITPFLSHLRYMRGRSFGRRDGHSGTYYILIVSVRHEGQLMEHEELLELERLFPENFRYHPILTRGWPEDWPYTKGRVVRVKPAGLSGHEEIDIIPLVQIVPDMDQYHVRMCGNREARDQLQRGLTQHGVVPLSFRAEVW